MTTRESKILSFRTDSIWILAGNYSSSIFETEISGLKAYVHLPLARKDALGIHTFVKPAILGDALLIDHEDIGAWGTPYLIQGGHLKSWAIQKIVIELVGSGFTESQLSEWAVTNLITWRNNVSDWASKLGDQIPEKLAREVNSPLIDNFEYYSFSPEMKLIPRRHVVQNIGVPLGDPKWGKALDETDFKRALHSVASGKLPRTVDNLYTQAKASFFKAQYRISVLEAALAVELHLQEIFIQNFGEDFYINIESCKNPITPRSTLGDLVQCANEKGIISTKIFNTNHVGIRNDAAHRDVQIQSSTAQAFIDAVKQVLALRKD